MQTMLAYSLGNNTGLPGSFAWQGLSSSRSGRKRATLATTGSGPAAPAGLRRAYAPALIPATGLSSLGE